MQIDKENKTIEPCECGYKPKKYTIGYGSNPYCIFCVGCGKKLGNGHSPVKEFIQAWNDKYRHIHAPEKRIDHVYAKE